MNGELKVHDAPSRGAFAMTEVRPNTDNLESNMGKHKFIEMVGAVWLNGKGVFAYEVDANTVQLRAETAGGKIISKIKNVGKDEFCRLKKVWGSGESLQSGVIAKRGFEFLGVTRHCAAAARGIKFLKIRKKT